MIPCERTVFYGVYDLETKMGLTWIYYVGEGKGVCVLCTIDLSEKVSTHRKGRKLGFELWESSTLWKLYCRNNLY